MTFKGKSGSTFIIFSSALYFSLKSVLIYRITVCLGSTFSILQTEVGLQPVLDQVRHGRVQLSLANL